MDHIPIGVYFYVAAVLIFYGAAFSGVLDDFFGWLNRRFPGRRLTADQARRAEMREVALFKWAAILFIAFAILGIAADAVLSYVNGAP